MRVWVLAASSREQVRKEESMKAVKYVIGGVLLLFAFLYIGILAIVATQETGSSELDQQPYLQVTYLGCEELGTTLENPQGDILEAYEDYTYYRLLFQVENKSNTKFWGDPADAVYVDGVEYDDVWEVYDYEIYDDPDWLFYGFQERTLPGKTSALAEIFVMVRDGVDDAVASYHTDWNNWEDGEEELWISLSQQIL